jgi:hypothetical protein
VPVITWEDAAHWGERPASEQSTPERWIPCIAHHSLETYALRVRGNSMTASSGQLKSYPVGSLVFVDTHLKTPEDGERIVARIDETGEVTFKVFKHEDGKRWLLPLNPRHEPIREAVHRAGHGGRQVGRRGLTCHGIAKKIRRIAGGQVACRFASDIQVSPCGLQSSDPPSSSRSPSSPPRAGCFFCATRKEDHLGNSTLLTTWITPFDW